MSIKSGYTLKAVGIRISALLLALIILTIPAASYASGDGAISVARVTALPGDSSVAVTVDYTGNPGVCCMALTFTYDTSALTLVGASSSFSGMTATPGGALTSPFTFVWDAADDVTYSGAVLTLLFSVSSSAVPGTSYSVGVSYSDGDIINGSLSSVSPSLSSGSVSVLQPLCTSGSDPFAAYVTSRSGAAANTHDLRFVLVARLDSVIDLESADVCLSFSGTSPKTLHKTLADGDADDFTLYTHVVAAGSNYAAAEGYALFGVVITGVPDSEWSSVQVTITDNSDSSKLFDGTVSALYALTGIDKAPSGTFVVLPFDSFD